MRPRTRWLLVVAVAGCVPDAETPTSVPTSRITYVNGASAPVLGIGETVVIEGSGFGQSLGEVRVTALGDTTVQMKIDVESWSDRFIVVTMPGDAVSGMLQVAPRTADVLEVSYVLQRRHAVPPNEITWQPSEPLPFIDNGAAVALGQDYTSGVLQTYLVAALTLPGDDSTRLYAGFVSGGRIASWERRGALPGPRGASALVIGTPHTSRLSSPRLYVIGGTDSEDAPTGTVVTAEIFLPDVEFGPFQVAASLPEALIRPRTLLALGAIYVSGGIGPGASPNQDVFLAHIRADGVLEGWFTGPSLPEPRFGHRTWWGSSALHVIGGASAAPSGTAIDTLDARLSSAQAAEVSERSGFFTTSQWSAPEPSLPSGRSRFTLLRLGDVVLAVGGVYAGAASSAAELLVAPITSAGLGLFAVTTAANSIAALGGGNLVDAHGVTWYDAQGQPHAAVLAGRHLNSGEGRREIWSF